MLARKLNTHTVTVVLQHQNTHTSTSAGPSLVCSCSWQETSPTVVTGELHRTPWTSIWLTESSAQREQHPDSLGYVLHQHTPPPSPSPPPLSSSADLSLFPTRLHMSVFIYQAAGLMSIIQWGRHRFTPVYCSSAGSKVIEEQHQSEGHTRYCD